MSQWWSRTPRASVQVSTEQQILDTESSTLGSLVDKARIEALPLANRNYTQILGLSPGVIVDLPNAAELGAGTENVTASDGATPLANNIQFNGVDANNLFRRTSAASRRDLQRKSAPRFRLWTPSKNFVCKLQTTMPAYGRGSGANVDLVSKSGTSKFHGSAWEFLRNNIFNANDFFSKLAGQPRPDLKQNQFGASLGGPIRNEHLFFFGAYQGLTEVNGFGDEQTAILPLLTSDRSASTLGAQFCPAGNPRRRRTAEAAGYFTAMAGGTQVACDGSEYQPGGACDSECQVAQRSICCTQLRRLFCQRAVPTPPIRSQWANRHSRSPPIIAKINSP